MRLTQLIVVVVACLQSAICFAEPEQLPPFPQCATTPGSSNDTGYALQAKHAFWVCEEGLCKASAYVSEGVFRCYKKHLDEPGRAACITRVRDRWFNHLPNLVNFTCPDCLERMTILNDIITRYRAFADKIVCDGAVNACQKKVLLAAGRMSLRIIGMHMGYWQLIYHGGCIQPMEDVAKRQFYDRIKRVTDCPPCLDLTTFADDVERDADTHNGDIFCATESELR